MTTTVPQIEVLPAQGMTSLALGCVAGTVPAASLEGHVALVISNSSDCQVFGVYAHPNVTTMHHDQPFGDWAVSGFVGGSMGVNPDTGNRDSSVTGRVGSALGDNAFSHRATGYAISNVVGKSCHANQGGSGK